MLQALADNTLGAIVIKDMDGRFLIANETFCAWNGTAREDIIGKSMHDFLSKEDTDKISAQERKVYDTGVASEEGRRLACPDGVIRDVIVKKFLIPGPGGGRPAIGTIITDITERKQAEEALLASDQLFRTAFEQEALGMALRAVGPRESHWLDVNQRFCNIFGYSRDELLRMTSIDITHPEDQEDAVKYNERLLNGEIKSYSREKRYIHKEGHIIWANIWLSAVTGSDGEPSKIISVIEDIT